MRPIIEFCASNMHLGTRAVMQELEANPDCDVIEYGCLGNCGECAVMPFALVEGVAIAADTPEELTTKIKEAVHSRKQLF